MGDRRGAGEVDDDRLSRHLRSHETQAALGDEASHEDKDGEGQNQEEEGVDQWQPGQVEPRGGERPASIEDDIEFRLNGRPLPGVMPK